jgi:signal transduction histidine kinase
MFSHALDKILSWVDLFIHPRVLQSADRTLLRRFRMAAGTMIFSFAPVSLFLLYQLTLDLDPVYKFLQIVQVALMASLLFLFRFTLQQRLVLYAFTTLSAFFMYLSVFSGEAVGYSTFLWLHALIVFTSFFIGPKTAWLIFVLNCLVAFFGTSRPFDSVETMVFLDTLFSGLVLMIICSAYDVIEKVSAEELRKNKQEIEDKQLQLIRASKFQALGEMAGGIAHEINNPLTVILSHADILEHDLGLSHPDYFSLQDRSRRIAQTAKRIDKIVKGMLGFARDGQFDQMVECELNEILKATLELFMAPFSTENAEVKLHLFSQPAYVRCAPSHLEQVFLNLLKNAQEAIQQQGPGLPKPWVKIDCNFYQGQAIMSFSNSGPEIPESISHRILEPFFTTKPIGVGTGLGLSLSKSLIESFGGRLFLAQRKPVQFVIELPLLSGPRLAPTDNKC